MDARQMLQILETELLPKIYGFCGMKLNSESEFGEAVYYESNI